MLVMVHYYRIRLVVIGLAINACYHPYRSDFYRSDQSSRQFTLLINCTIGLLALLSKLAIIFTDLTFICLIGT